MTPQELFVDRLRQIVDVFTERGDWFAIWPVRTERGLAWLRRVNYTTTFELPKGFVTRYSEKPAEK